MISRASSPENVRLFSIASAIKCALAPWRCAVFKTIGKYVPPAPGVKSPALWGTEARLEELFGNTALNIRATNREFDFRYHSATHWIEVFRTYYGPMNKTFGALDTEKQAAFSRDLLALMESRNRSGDTRWCCRASTSKS